MVMQLLNLSVIAMILLAGQQFLLFECRILCLCGAAFYTLGAYVVAVSTCNGAIGTAPSVAISVIVCGVFSLIIGYPLLRALRADFFALATLGVAQGTFVALRAAAPGGLAGMAGIPALESPWSALLGPDGDALLVNGALMLLALVFLGVLRQRRFGRLAKAVGIDEHALSVVGHRPLLIKLQVFAMSAVLAGLAGALRATYLGVVDPGMSSIEATVLVLVGTIVSGARSVWGCAIGAVFLVVIPEELQQVGSDRFGPHWHVFPAVNIVYGMLIIGAVFVSVRRLRHVSGDRHACYS